MSVFAKTALGTEVEVAIMTDCGSNKGGYYCEIYLNGIDDDPYDYFVIHKEDLTKGESEEKLAKKYVSSITEY